MTTRKITVSLPEELVAAAEAAVAAGRARSISAYLADTAGATELRTRSIHDVIAAWEARHGAPSGDQATDAQEWAESFMARNDARWHARRDAGTAA